MHSAKPSAMRLPVFLAFALLACRVAAMPSFSGTEPLAIAPGKTVEVKVIGNGFGDDLRLWTSFGAAKLVKRINAQQAIFTIAAHADARGVGVLRLHDRSGLSDARFIAFDSTPATKNISTDKTKPALLKLPAAIDSKTGGVHSHWFTFEAKAGQRLAIEVFAERIGSEADPMIRLLNPMGREVNYADDDEVLGSDAGLVHTAKVAGQYRLELRDVQYRGGQAYRLRVGGFDIWPELKPAAGAVIEKEPNNNPAQATPLSLGKSAFGRIEEPGARDHFSFTGKKDDWVTIRAFSRSVGSPAYIYLELLNKDGSAIATAGTENTRQTVLRHRLPADGSYTLRVEELIRAGGPRHAYRLTTHAGGGAFQLNLKTDKNKADRFWVIPGQQVNLPLQIERHGYDGAITLTAGWPAAESIKAKAKDFTGKFTVPANAKPGTLHHLRITGAGEGDSPAKSTLDLLAAHRARWPQLAFPPAVLRHVVPVAIIEPTRITVAGIKLKAGAKAKIRITTLRPPPPIGQKAAPQPITIQLKNLPSGIKVPEKITVAANKNFVEFELTAPAEAEAGKHSLVVVAKGKYRGTDWTRESKPVTLEVLPK